MPDDHAWVDDIWRQSLRPPEALTVSQWADRHRMLPTHAAEPGRWKTDRTPYLAAVMDALSAEDPCERVVFMKGAQIGGSECGLNWIGYVIDHAPGVMLMVMPSLDMVRRNTATRIDPLIEATPRLRSRVVPARSRDSGNSASRKAFPNGELLMTGANSASGLRSTPVRYLFLDEVDAYPTDADGEGDPVALAIQRTATYRGRRKIFLASTPTHKGLSRIEAAFEESDKQEYRVPCPGCGTHWPISWQQIHWPEGEPHRAHLACPDCGTVIEESEKPNLLANGHWHATAKGDGRTKGFHLSALYSPFETWGEIATEFLAAKGDPARLQAWINTKLGESFEDAHGEAPEPHYLLSRLEPFPEYLPSDVALITAGVDVQDDRLEIEIVGWGAGEESWSLEHLAIWEDPSSPATWTALAKILDRTWPHPRMPTAMGIKAACIDSGGHHTLSVYGFTRPRQGRRIWAIKGRGGTGVPVWPRQPSRNTKGAAPVYIVGVDALKEATYARLRIAEPGPGYCHFPAGRSMTYFEQLTVERVRTRYHKGYPRREWINPSGKPNEALDLRVYATAALAGLRQIHVTVEGEASRFVQEPLGTASTDGVIRSRWL